MTTDNRSVNVLLFFIILYVFEHIICSRAPFPFLSWIKFFIIKKILYCIVFLLGSINEQLYHFTAPPAVCTNHSLFYCFKAVITVRSLTQTFSLLFEKYTELISMP